MSNKTHTNHHKLLINFSTCSVNNAYFREANCLSRDSNTRDVKQILGKIFQVFVGKNQKLLKTVFNSLQVWNMLIQSLWKTVWMEKGYTVTIIQKYLLSFKYSCFFISRNIDQFNVNNVAEILKMNPKRRVFW